MTSNISKKYVKLEQREHVLQKPGMYVGSIEIDQYDLWLINEDGTQVTKNKVNYNPALFKIFDEIVDNATDQYFRLKKFKEAGQDVNLVKDIKITVDKESGIISVYNSGDGIEIVKHPEHDMYIPELVFGNLMTSANFTDEHRTGAGMNGLGASLTNIFSEWFEIETVDAERKQVYNQRFEKNMSITNKPIIKKCVKKPYTVVNFKPDYTRFHLENLSEDMYQVIRKRTYDLCAVTDKDVNIYFNEKKLDFKSFEKYVDLYLGSKTDHTRVYEQINESWEVVASYNDFGGFEQVSFVNGLLTISGGKHVDYIVNQIVKKMTEMIGKKSKSTIKPQAIKDNMIIFIKCTIVNPSFDSQSKETLTTPSSKFGSKAEISDKFIEKLFKSGLADKVLEICALHEEKSLKKTDGKKRDILRGLPKLEDANWAGTLKSKECLLLLTEGDSACSMAISGLEEVGRDKYGVFPLKGKVMNVKDTSVQKIADNEEISNLKKIIGLETGKKYQSLDDLRYGGIMLLTDQDSVTGDTPVLLKKNDLIEIKYIGDLTHEWEVSPNGKDYGKTDYQIWTEKGWTNIKHVMRHKVNKRIFRVLTHTGLVDVTEDHSLLNMKGEKITPNECKVNDLLLHSFPENIPEKLYDITEDEAFVMGLFFVDGSCEKENTWYISNNNYELLYKSKHILEKIYDFEFNIIENNTLIINGVKSIVDKYQDLFYYKNGNKYISSKLLNAPRNIREKLLEGYNSCHMERIIDIKSKISSQCIFYLYKSLGYEISINYQEKHSTFNLVEGHQQDNPNRIKKIWDLGTTEQYVYDLETDNHHFQAGIGQMICHNTDASHIRSLVMNLFHTLWPTLMKDFSFIHCMQTPIVKATRYNDTQSFYCLTDFNNWKAQNPTGWDIKYYKGLGTSTEDEAKEYFKTMKKCTYKFTEKTDEHIDMAFNKKRADDRKTWLGSYDKNVILDYNDTEVTYDDFINKELIHFSNYDIERSLPCMIDGLKISQRKILFSCFKRNLTSKEIRVAQLAAYVSEQSAYHHGETSLQGAIINMAQIFVGSNNINLLCPNGMFGGRHHGGKDAAQPRYIYTLLSDLAQSIFKKQDNCILNYLYDDELKVEPDHYVPIIPMLLVNGCIGIGTGFSTTIPCYNPLDICGLLKKMLAGKHVSAEDDDLVPWYRGFKGEIKKINNKFHSIGKYAKISATKIEITELPIGYWTFDFKSDLEDFLDKITEFKKYENYSAGDKVHFILHFSNQGTVDKLLKTESNGFTKLENTFKLVSSRGLSTTNMYAFNVNKQITKYDNSFDLINEFYDVRLEYYNTRKEFILNQLQYDIDILNNKIRFIKEVVEENIHVHKMTKKDLELYLVDNDYMKHEDKYDYITRIPIYNITIDKVRELEDEIEKSLNELKELRDKKVETIWTEELNEFEKIYLKFLDDCEKKSVANKKKIKK